MKYKEKGTVIGLQGALKELKDKMSEFINALSENPLDVVRMYAPERIVFISSTDSGSITDLYQSDYGSYYHSTPYDCSEQKQIIYFDTIIIQLNNTWYSVSENKEDKDYLKIESEELTEDSITRSISNGNTTIIIKTPIINLSVEKAYPEQAANMLSCAILKSLCDEEVYYITETNKTKGA